MGVGVQGDRYGGVTKHLGDYLRVDVAGEQQRGAGVPEVVEADLREPGPLQQRLEAVLRDVAAVEELPDLRSEYKAPFSEYREPALSISPNCRSR